ncbi:MAG: MGMT family protein, partial [Bacteroidota bacterium]
HSYCGFSIGDLFCLGGAFCWSLYILRLSDLGSFFPPIQLQVWKALLQIPTAQLRTYQDIGQDIGKPKAVRAIGTAIGKNPIAYLIPCHRVIRGDGQMGNYRWQPERKMAINGFERARFLATEA